MSASSRLLLVVLGLALAAASAAAQGEKPTPGGADEKKGEVKPPRPGRILGRVVWKGPVFAPREVLWPAGLPDADEKLAEIAAARPVLDRRLLVDADSGGVAACVVSIPALRLPAEPPRRLELVVSSLAFSTRAAVLPEGWALQIRNEDPIVHRFVLRRGNERVRDVEVDPGAVALVDGIVGGEHRLESERLPFLAARVVPRARTPRVTTDRVGTFDIRGAPAGPLEIEIDHETLGRLRREVVVPDGGTLELEILASDFERADEAGLPFGPAGPVALEIDGIPVPRAYLDRLADFMARRHAAVAMPRRISEEEALRRGAMPLAAMWSRTAERRAELGPRLAEVRALLDSGQDLGLVAERLSDEPVERRGRPLSRRARDLEPNLGAAVFAAPIGRVVGPIATPRGLSFIVVDRREGAKDDETRNFRHLFLAFHPEDDAARREGRAAEAAARSRVKVVDPAWKDLVPEDHLR